MELAPIVGLADIIVDLVSSLDPLPLFNGPLIRPAAPLFNGPFIGGGA